MNRLLTLALLVLVGLSAAGCQTPKTMGKDKLATSFTVDSHKVSGKKTIVSKKDLPKLQHELADWGGKEGKITWGLAVKLSFLAAELKCSDFRVNSGYRTKSHQKSLVAKGKTPAKGEGFHPKGMAVDLRVYCANGRQIPALKVAEAAVKVGFGGVATYPGNKAGPYAHLDDRKTKGVQIASWGYQAAKIKKMARQYASLRMRSDKQMMLAYASPTSNDSIAADVPWELVGGEDEKPQLTDFTITAEAGSWDGPDPFFGANPTFKAANWQLRGSLD